MDILKKLKHELEKEIGVISDKNDISPNELDRLDKAVDIIKDIETIYAMHDYEYEGEDDYKYIEHYAPKSNRYTNSDHELRAQLMEKMNTTKSDKERAAIQALIDLWKD